jgi:hypothetical protein
VLALLNQRNRNGSTLLSIFIAQSCILVTSFRDRQHGPEYKFNTHSRHAEHLALFPDAGADLFTVNDKGEGLLHMRAGRADNLA